MAGSVRLLEQTWKHCALSRHAAWKSLSRNSRSAAGGRWRVSIQPLSLKGTVSPTMSSWPYATSWSWRTLSPTRLSANWRTAFGTSFVWRTVVCWTTVVVATGNQRVHQPVGPYRWNQTAPTVKPTPTIKLMTRIRKNIRPQGKRFGCWIGPCCQTSATGADGLFFGEVGATAGFIIGYAQRAVKRTAVTIPPATAT